MIRTVYRFQKLKVIKKACEKGVGPLRVFGKAKKRIKVKKHVGRYEGPMAHRLFSLAHLKQRMYIDRQWERKMGPDKRILKIQ